MYWNESLHCSTIEVPFTNLWRGLDMRLKVCIIGNFGQLLISGLSGLRIIGEFLVWQFRMLCKYLTMKYKVVVDY